MSIMKEKMRTVRLITCDNVTEAHLIKGFLANEGINSFVSNENFSSLMPHYNNMLGSGVQIYVMESDYDKSRKLIRDIWQPDNEKIVCPNCGSKKIKLGIGNSKIKKIINIVLALISFFPLGNIKARYYCKDCKEDFQ